ncbi:MAG: hypothetical protein WC686_03665 [Candidatus Shapirobacteria bacterium]
MRSELEKHLPPLLALFLVISLFWALNLTPWPNFLILFLGLAVGSFFLDVDHLIYWFFLKPNTQESRLAQATFRQKDVKSLIKLLALTSKEHTNLIFHHYFFQVILALMSFFVFTSTTSIFIMAFLLASNVHLIVDEVTDLKHDKPHLQKWLFAREKKQLSLDYLRYYVLVFIFFSLLFLLLLIRFRS